MVLYTLKSRDDLLCPIVIQFLDTYQHTTKQHTTKSYIVKTNLESITVHSSLPCQSPSLETI